MKIAIITDIHHGPQSHTKKDGWNGLGTVENFVQHAHAAGADLILDLGDHISDSNHETDVKAATEVATTLATFKGPRYHVLGNHDVNNLSIADNEAIFGQSMQSQVIDLGEIRLVLWQPGVKITAGIGFPRAADEIDWLVAALNADDRPAIIATHVPLSGHSQIGNYYFQRNPQYSTYPDHDSVREAVEATGKAALWLSGHVHWNTLTNVGGVQHLTIQSASERFTTYPLAAEAFAMLTIEEGQFTIDVQGNDPFHARLPFRKSGERPWMSPLRPFNEIAERADVEHEGA